MSAWWIGHIARVTQRRRPNTMRQRWPRRWLRAAESFAMMVLDVWYSLTRVLKAGKLFLLGYGMLVGFSPPLGQSSLRWPHVIMLAIQHPLQQASTLSAAPDPRTRQSVTGLKCSASFQDGLATGWNAYRRRGFVEQIWFLPALDRRSRFSAVTPRLKLRKGARFAYLSS